MSAHLENAEDVDFIIKTAIERDPKKRRVKPVDTQSSILDFDLGESSDDSDFRIEDHPDLSDDDSIGTNDSNSEASSSEDEEEDDESDNSDFGKKLKIPTGTNGSISDIIKKAESNNLQFTEKDADILICCGCLGDQSDGINEIAECDGCGVTVHEACYGISDSNSLASTDSLSPTTPWFCDACKAGVLNPVCELCPNSGGVFKETDVGKWVHLVCALYVPGVAFGEVDKLSSVTLFEMQYSKWGAKTCSLCLDERFSRTGVCIGCDAGLCRNYFHVTCAQREGFLSEAHSEEVDQADPFYAHCKLHSEKAHVKRRKRNYMTIQLRTHFRKLQFEASGHSESAEQQRIQRKLAKKRLHYQNLKSLRTPPWVPTQKMPRLLTTSASACRKLLRKAELMGVDTVALEMQEAQVAALVDIRKKWHIPPAFSVEFIAYYLDRNERLKSMKTSLETLLQSNKQLLIEQQELRVKYDELLKESTDEQRTNSTLRTSIQKYHSAILTICPNKNLTNVDDIGKPLMRQPPQPQMMVPTAGALKIGVGFPLNNIPANRNESGKVLSSQAAKQEAAALATAAAAVTAAAAAAATAALPIELNECGICREKSDQHMLAKCDTCHLYYHLNCLNPPLTRLPKKSKLYGWQCSECDKSSDSEMERTVAKQPRRSRGRHSREGRHSFLPASVCNNKDVTPTPMIKIKPVEEPQPNNGPAVSIVPTIQTPVTLTVRKIPSPTYSNATYTATIITSSSGQENAANSSVGNLDSTTNVSSEETKLVISKTSKKRRREKHKNRYSPELGGSFTKEHKRKRKKKSLDMENPNPHPRITIKIKPIPLPAGELPSTSNPQCFYVNNASDEGPPMATTNMLMPTVAAVPIALQKQSQIAGADAKVAPCSDNNCDVCKERGTSSNMVMCDDCHKNYHFTCLEPPLKKTPKKRGYSWHCADCDPTGSE